MENLRESYDWFLSSEDWVQYPDPHGTLWPGMSVDFATLNYVTLDEIAVLEEAGIVERGLKPFRTVEEGEQEYLWRMD